VGVEAAQVARIASAAGVAYGTFYSHFESKQAVLLACSRRTAERVRARLDAVGLDAITTAEAFFTASAEAHVDAPIDVPELRADVWKAAIQQPDDPQHAHVVHTASLVERLRAAGVFPASVDAEALARVWLTSLLGFLARGASPSDLVLLARVFADGAAGVSRAEARTDRSSPPGPRPRDGPRG
jgi:AcrR family transcriptional regulator